MSQERIEAAAKAAYVEYSQEPDFDAEAAWEDMRGKGDYETGIWSLVAQGATAAADAVMFSDEAIERAENAVYSLAAINAPEVVRAVVAALKGDA